MYVEEENKFQKRILSTHLFYGLVELKPQDFVALEDGLAIVRLFRRFPVHLRLPFGVQGIATLHGRHCQVFLLNEL